MRSLLPHMTIPISRARRSAFKVWVSISTIVQHRAWNYNNLGYLPIEFTLMVRSGQACASITLAEERAIL